MGVKRNAFESLVLNLKESVQVEEPYVDWRISKWALKKWQGNMWAGFIGFNVRTGDGFCAHGVEFSRSTECREILNFLIRTTLLGVSEFYLVAMKC